MATKVVNANTEMGASGPNHCSGMVPDPGSTTGTNRFLREDAEFEPLTTANLPANTAVISFGAGVPSGSSTTGYIYFNTSTTPYTGYVYNSGWQQFS